MATSCLSIIYIFSYFGLVVLVRIGASTNGRYHEYSNPFYVACFLVFHGNGDFSPSNGDHSMSSTLSTMATKHSCTAALV